MPASPGTKASGAGAPAKTATSRAPRKTARAQPRAADTPGVARPSAPAEASVDKLDTSYLESLIGYNARRAALAVIAVFLERLAPFGLRPVDFSVLSLITHNPGVTARQLCHALGILPPNMVGTLNSFERSGLLERRPHPTDRRAQGLHLTAKGRRVMKQAEQVAAALEQDVAHRLSAQEQQTLRTLLQKIYL